MHGGKLLAAPSTCETCFPEIETGILTDFLCFMRSPPPRAKFKMLGDRFRTTLVLLRMPKGPCTTRSHAYFEEDNILFWGTAYEEGNGVFIQKESVTGWCCKQREGHGTEHPGHSFKLRWCCGQRLWTSLQRHWRRQGVFHCARECVYVEFTVPLVPWTGGHEYVSCVITYRMYAYFSLTQTNTHTQNVGGSVQNVMGFVDNWGGSVLNTPTANNQPAYQAIANTAYDPMMGTGYTSYVPSRTLWIQ